MTKGSILGHLLHLAAFMSVSMVLQTLYFLIDLYFVSSIGKEAVAGVSLVGNLQLAVLALTQMLGVGTTTLIAHATGRGDREDARTVFNQACLLSVVLGAGVWIAGYLLSGPYCRGLSADAATIEQAEAYLLWFVPSLGLQFPLVAMGSALRGIGLVKPGLVVQVLSVGLNAILAPVLIAGWGTGRPLGVAGAALSTLGALIVGVLAMTWYVRNAGSHIAFDPQQWTPRFDVWKRMLNIGLPAGGEFALFSLYGSVVYWIIRGFGASAQAGFGIGGRVMQSVFLPVMAISFAASPLAGQNFGARRHDRVRDTFRMAALLGSVLMLCATLLCQLSPATLIRPFTRDAAVISFGTEYLTIASWTFVASGLIFTISGLFQALGNTWPSLACSATRIVLFVLPAIWLSAQPGFALRHLWYLSVVTIAIQAGVSFAMLQREFRRKLAPVTPPAGL